MDVIPDIPDIYLERKLITTSGDQQEYEEESNDGFIPSPIMPRMDFSWNKVEEKDNLVFCFVGF